MTTNQSNQPSAQSDPWLRRKAIRKSWVYHDVGAVPMLLQALQDREQYRACIADILADDSTSNAALACTVLSDFQSPDITEVIESLYANDQDARIRWTATVYLVRAGRLSVEAIYRDDMAVDEKLSLARLAASTGSLSVGQNIINGVIKGSTLSEDICDQLPSLLRLDKNESSIFWLDTIVRDYAQIIDQPGAGQERKELLDEYWTLVDRMLDHGLDKPLDSLRTIRGVPASKRYAEFVRMYWKRRGLAGWVERIKAYMR